MEKRKNLIAVRVNGEVSNMLDKYCYDERSTKVGAIEKAIKLLYKETYGNPKC